MTSCRGRRVCSQCDCLRRRWRQGVWDQARQTLTMGGRKPGEQEPSPTAAILDGSSVGTRDQITKIKGGKREIPADTDGRQMTVGIHSTPIRDRNKGNTMLKVTCALSPLAERGMAWLIKNRRLVCDREHLATVPETRIAITAAATFTSRRIS